MISQISKNENYTTLNDKYTICAEWLNIAQIKQNNFFIQTPHS